MAKADDNRVAVAGTGLVCCLGCDVSAVYAAMCRGECGMRVIDRFPVTEYAQTHGGQIRSADESALRDMYPDEDFAGALVLAAGRDALRDGGHAVAVPDARRGLILATNFGPAEAIEWAWREQRDTGRAEKETVRLWTEFVARMAQGLGCGGPRTQISLSCASGAAAAALGWDWIRQGRADRVLAIGYDILTELCWAGLANMRTITPELLRPFDARRSGTLFGEGAAAMLLERAGTNAGNGSVKAWLLGAATNNNAFHMTAPAKNGEGSRRVMAAALRAAGLAPMQVEHVCAHATGTVANDATEAAALQALFGGALPRLTVAAHKSQFGHMLGAAGVAETVITVEVMRHGRIPPTVNHEVADPACPVDCVPRVARERQVAVAITNSAGIGGNNAALVLAAGTYVPEEAGSDG